MAVANYLWDDDNIALETDEADATIAEYTYEPEQYGNLISEHRSGQTYQHHYDALGSTRMLTDENGQITDTFEYDAWGNELAHTGTTETPFRWVGELGYYFVSETNQYSVRIRRYNPAIARWTSIDPDWANVGQGQFPYATNNPTNYIDASGNVPVVKDCLIDLKYKSLENTQGCGRFNWEVKYSTPPKNGFIIQRVDIDFRYRDCHDKFLQGSTSCGVWTTNDETKARPTSFYELWTFKKDNLYYGKAPNLRKQDKNELIDVFGFEGGGDDKTGCGYVSIEGEFREFPGPDPPGGWKKWHMARKPNSPPNQLAYRCDTPEGWRNATLNPGPDGEDSDTIDARDVLARSIFHQFNCCGCPNICRYKAGKPITRIQGEC